MQVKEQTAKQRDPGRGNGWSVLHEPEVAVVNRLLDRLERQEKKGEEGRRAILDGIARLKELWRAIARFPSVLDAQSLGKRYRNFDTLVETFSHVNPYVAEAYLPTRAVLGRGYAMAKFNFCRLLGVIVEEFMEDDPDIDDLEEEVEAVMRDSVCTIIAEDLLMSIASDERLEEELRRRAATVLAGLWERREVRAVHAVFRVSPERLSDARYFRA